MKSRRKKRKKSEILTLAPSRKGECSAADEQPTFHLQLEGWCVVDTAVELEFIKKIVKFMVAQRRSSFPSLVGKRFYNVSEYRSQMKEMIIAECHSLISNGLNEKAATHAFKLKDVYAVQNAHHIKLISIEMNFVTSAELNIRSNGVVYLSCNVHSDTKQSLNPDVVNYIGLVGSSTLINNVDDFKCNLCIYIYDKLELIHNGSNFAIKKVASLIALQRMFCAVEELPINETTKALLSGEGCDEQIWSWVVSSENDIRDGKTLFDEYMSRYVEDSADNHADYGFLDGEAGCFLPTPFPNEHQAGIESVERELRTQSMNNLGEDIENRREDAAVLASHSCSKLGSLIPWSLQTTVLNACDCFDHNHGCSLLKLNSLQQKVVEEAIFESPRIKLIQGPPGTGKSTALTTLLCGLLLNPTTKISPVPRILVTSPSNKGVQVLLTKLVQAVNEFSVVASSRSSPSPFVLPSLLYIPSTDALMKLPQTPFHSSLNLPSSAALPSSPDCYVAANVPSVLRDYCAALSTTLQNARGSIETLSQSTSGQKQLHKRDSKKSALKKAAEICEKIEAFLENFGFGDVATTPFVNAKKLKTSVTQRKSVVGDCAEHLNLPLASVCRKIRCTIKELSRKTKNRDKVQRQHKNESLKSSVCLQFNSLFDDITQMSMTINELPARADLTATAFRHANVVFSTLVSSGRPDLKRLAAEHPFDLAIVDEAGQCVEPEVLIAVAASQAKQIILAGDHFQLGATVSLPALVNNGFSFGLFSRLASAGVPHTRFLTQYRMSPRIRSYPSRVFYADKLKDGANVLTATQRFSALKLPLWMEDAVFVDVQDSHESSGLSQSLVNKKEARVVNALHAFLLGLGFRADCISILSFYAGQVALIKQLLDCRKQPTGPARAHTVDGFQGEENDVIILSCVRSQPHRVGFLTDFRRINVALTRARSLLFVVGNAHCFAHSGVGFLQELVKDLKSRSALVSAAKIGLV
eukprot:GCRY01005994.1.p1 GENE.GCRY01005994.1~~GCRY01005994.1.p1  ORF type:complete len:980 (-),score=123.40 GCRY01005994.1:57-2996(-)